MNENCLSSLSRKVSSLDFCSREEQMARMEKDRFVCDLVGIELLDAKAGWAKVALVLTPLHLNGVGIVQGGVLFTLADFAFAAACNYTQQAVVVIDASISYLKSTRSGTITAEAKEVSRTRRFASGLVEVKNENNELLAIFQARGYALEPVFNDTIQRQ